jgi:small subunit ribosomal protein S2
MREDGSYEKLTKKERLTLDRQHENLMKNLAGIRDMKSLPDMLFIIDVRKEDIAVKEANRLGIPVVAVVDTNCSPDGVDYVIPGNDDALRAVRLFASRIADAILEGQQIATEGGVASAAADAGADDAADINGPEPEVKVADQTWETAEQTHPVELEAGAEEKAEAGSEEAAEPAAADAAAETAGEVKQEQTEETNEASAS